MHGWERCSHPFSDSFRDCPKRGASNAQPINLARMRQAKWTEKPLCGDSRGQTASASEAFRTVSPGSALAIRLHSKPRRLGVADMPAGLLPSRSARATREKSHAPTTPFAPTQAHRQRLDVACGTKLPARKHQPPVSSYGDA